MSDFSNFISKNEQKIEALPRLRRRPIQLVAHESFEVLYENVLLGGATNGELNSLAFTIVKICDRRGPIRDAALDAIGLYASDGQTVRIDDFDAARKALVAEMLEDDDEPVDKQAGGYLLMNMLSNNLELKLKFVEYCHMYSAQTIVSAMM